MRNGRDGTEGSMSGSFATVCRPASSAGGVAKRPAVKLTRSQPVEPAPLETKRVVSRNPASRCRPSSRRWAPGSTAR